MTDICPTCGEDAKPGKKTCDDPMCNEEYAQYIRTTFKVVPREAKASATGVAAAAPPKLLVP